MSLRIAATDHAFAQGTARRQWRTRSAISAQTWSGEWWALGGGGTVWDAIAACEELISDARRDETGGAGQVFADTTNHEVATGDGLAYTHDATNNRREAHSNDPVCGRVRPPTPRE